MSAGVCFRIAPCVLAFARLAAADDLVVHAQPETAHAGGAHVSAGASNVLDDEPLSSSENGELVPAARLALSTEVAVGVMNVSSSAAIAVGAREGDRHADLRLAAVHTWSRLSAGLESRTRIDLSLDPDDTTAERQWEANAGTVASYSFGPFAMSARAGVATYRMRFSPGDRTGALALVGVTGTF